MLLSLFCILISFLVFGTFYRFSAANAERGDADFSMMSYNVRSLNQNGQIPIADVDSSIIKFILRESPDILSIQESHHTMRGMTPLDRIYPYKFVDFEYGIPKTEVVNSLFSKHPILNYGVIDFPNSDNAALFAEIVMNQDTVRVYNLHLQSFSVIPNVAHLQSEASGKLLKRITRGLQRQEEQVLLIRKHISNSPYPVILTGDFNNTQFSKVYRIMKDGFKDSFVEVGSGFGRTFTFFGLPMRIDYLFADEHFEVISHTNYGVELSDHYPVKAGFKLKPEE